MFAGRFLPPLVLRQLLQSFHPFPHLPLTSPEDCLCFVDTPF